MNITSYVNALPYKSVLSPGHLALAAIGNQYYGVPYLSDLSVLWYNKALFKKAGIAGPPDDVRRDRLRRQGGHARSAPRRTRVRPVVRRRLSGLPRLRDAA